MNIVTDAKSQLTPEASLLAAHPTATGILTVDPTTAINSYLLSFAAAHPVQRRLCGTAGALLNPGHRCAGQLHRILDLQQIGDDPLLVFR